MNLVEDAYFNVNSANFLGVTTIDTWLATDDAAANNALLELFKCVFDVFCGMAIFASQFSSGTVAKTIDRNNTSLLIDYLVSRI
jgi:hypothetical protein